MKIAIPTAEGALCMHFGHCEKFAIVEVDDNKKIVAVDYQVPPPHEPGLLPKWLHERDVTAVIAGGMGMRAQQIFEQNGISVCTGASVGKVEDIVTEYLNGTLVTGDNACDH